MTKINPNARMRAAIAPSGLDTATSDMRVADGAMLRLHNLRYSGKGWRNVRPFSLLHDLHASDENRETFRNLSIVYHHPSAGEDTYIVSVPRSDGRIDLAMASSTAEGTFILHNESDKTGLNPCYISHLATPSMNGGMIVSWEHNIQFGSVKPVASDVSVTLHITVADSAFNHILTIPTGSTSASFQFSTASGESQPVISSDDPVPESDAAQTYRLYPSSLEAERAASSYFATDLPSDIRIGHFGNILILTNTVRKEIYYYYLVDGYYRKFEYPEPPIVRQSPELTMEDASHKTRIKYFDKPDLYNKTTGTFVRANTDGDYFWGEICYFAAFELFDGRVLSPSALNIAAAEPYYPDQLVPRYTDDAAIKAAPGQLLEAYDTDDTIITANNTFQFMICPWVEISIPGAIDTYMIRNVNIYSTRINPIWDAEKLNNWQKWSGGIVAPEKYYADNDLPAQPFYLVKSVPVKEFDSSGKYSLYLTGALLKDIEQIATTYEPVEVHSAYFEIHKEYNERLHVARNFRLHLFKGYGDAIYPADVTGDDRQLVTRITVDNRSYNVAVPENHGTLAESFIYNKIISYPDFRASAMFDTDNMLQASHIVELKSAVSSNFAYATSDSGSIKKMVADTPTIPGDLDEQFDTKYTEVDYGRIVKYSACFAGASCLSPSSQRLSVSSSLEQSNKLRVSAQNNPFSFPLANTYAIGTDANSVLAINSAAIEMSDTKFGEFPLYVFTEEGIFTLQAGSGDLLYAAVIPLNYDRIINPETLAINYNILYITSQGLHAMFSNQSSLISEPINNLFNLPLVDFLGTARLCYQHKFGEIILYNPAADASGARLYLDAYVFSLAAKTWSTRDFAGVKLNTDEIVHRIDDTSIRIFDLNDESDGLLPIRLVSRPIKLGSMEFKRLETLITRFWSSVALSFRVSVEGSIDLKQWLPLRDMTVAADRDIILRRTPHSFRYLRIALAAEVNRDFCLSGFDLEYYVRFLHRLR